MVVRIEMPPEWGIFKRAQISGEQRAQQQELGL